MPKKQSKFPLKIFKTTTTTAKKPKQNTTSSSKNQSSFVEYKRKLSDFYKDLNFLSFMQNKREIARQDVLLTKKGPVELYRRDANGREKVLEPRSILESKAVDPQSRSFLKKIYNNHRKYSSRPTSRTRTYSTVYDHHSAYSSRPSSIHRDPKGRYGCFFDWYEPRHGGRITRILHEDIEVLPYNGGGSSTSTYMPHNSHYSRPSSVYRAHSRGLPFDWYAPRNGRISKVLHEHIKPLRYSRSDSYTSDTSYDYRNEPAIDRRKYNIYEYYEYDDDDSDDHRYSRRRNNKVVSRSSRTRHRSPSPNFNTDEMPVAPLRRSKKKISYIDYDQENNNNNNKNHENSRKRQSPLSSSASGKELWKKVDTYATTIAVNGGETTAAAAIQPRSISPRNIHNDYDDNFILVPAHNQQPQQFYLNNNNNNSNQSAVVNKSESSILPFQNNFKKRSTNSIIEHHPSSFKTVEKSDSRYNDLPGNDALRTNPLFDAKNDKFMY